MTFTAFPMPFMPNTIPRRGRRSVRGRWPPCSPTIGFRKTRTGGLDHGTWSVLKFLYPEADVPVFQLSVDLGKDLAWHLELGKTLSTLRDRGVLILGSGNVVHNLRALRWSGPPHDWTAEFDRLFADYLDNRDFGALADWRDRRSLLSMAHPTLEHYIPALTVAGASNAKDSLFVTTEGLDLGALSMRSFVFHGS